MAKFTMRTSAPDKSNKYYYADNIFYQSGYGLPNCTCYAWGRWYELLGSKPKLYTGNAETWWGYNDGYERGQTPKVGAIICWRKGQAGYSADGAGHVAVVEKVNADGSILTSNSNYSGTLFYTKTLNAPNYFIANGLTLQGFIYLPIEFDDEPKQPTNEDEKRPTTDSFFPTKGYFALGDTHTNVGRIAEFMYRVFPAYTSKSALGDYYGPNIHASIKEFQRRTGLETDGCVGPITLAELQKYGFDK